VFKSSGDDDIDDEDDDQVSIRGVNDSDWHIERDMINSAVIPTEPNSEYSAFEVTQLCIRNPQLVNEPSENTGLQRCFPFFTWECKKLTTARKGGDEVDRFCKYGVLSPTLQPFMRGKVH
jgi:hypothetical protein